MSDSRVKSSIYLNQRLHERAKALSHATSISLNAHVALALEEYLQRPDRAAAVERMLSETDKQG